MTTTRRVVIAVFTDVDLLDVTGPAEVFALANRETGGRAGYQVQLAGPAAGVITTSAGIRLVADLSFAEVDGVLDTLLVPGGVDMPPEGPVARIDPDIVAWLKTTAPPRYGGARVMSTSDTTYSIGMSASAMFRTLP